MHVVCAYCGRDLGFVEPLTDPRTSHGMCPECGDFFTGQVGQRLSDFLERLPAPVLVVDSEGRALAANRALAALVGKPPETIPGLLGGDVMECAYARLPGGCGKAVHCAACTIRLAVTATWEDGATRRQAASLERAGGPVALEITTALEPGRGVRVTIEGTKKP